MTRWEWLPVPEFRVVPFDRTHLGVVREWLLDEETRDLVGTRVPPSDVQHERWFEALQADAARMTFLVTEAGMDRPLGIVGLTGIDRVARSAELWLYVGDRAKRGLGVGRVAVRETLRFAFGTHGLHRVFVRVFGYNAGARGFFAALGFIDEGIERAGTFRHGRFHDVWRMAVLSDEFH